jgi:hypothetical protein
VLSPSYGVVFGGARILVVVVILCDVPGPDGVVRLCVIFRDVPSDPSYIDNTSPTTLMPVIIATLRRIDGHENYFWYPMGKNLGGL